MPYHDPKTRGRAGKIKELAGDLIIEIPISIWRRYALEKIRAVVVYYRYTKTNNNLLLNPVLYQDLSNGVRKLEDLTFHVSHEDKTITIPILIDPEMPLGQFALEDTVTKERTYFKL